MSSNDLGFSSVGSLTADTTYYFYVQSRVIRRGPNPPRDYYDYAESEVIPCTTNIDDLTDLICLDDKREQTSLTLKWTTNGNDFQLQYRRFGVGDFMGDGQWYVYDQQQRVLETTVSRLTPGHYYEFRLIKRKAQ